MFTLPFKGKYFFVTWIVFGSSVGSRSSESEGVVKLLTEFSEAAEIAYGSISGVYWYLLCGGGYILDGNGRLMHSWAKKISCKVIIELVINRPVVVI